MKKILIVATLAAIMASSASAIELSIRPNWDDTGDKLELNLSETGVLTISMEMFAGDGNVSFFNAFLDAMPFRSGDSKGYDVVGTEFKMTRDNGSGWFRNEGDWDANIENYSLIAADDEGGDPIGTNGPGPYDVDSIIIHGTQVGSYDLYYENARTAEGATRTPGLFDAANNQHGYAINLRIPGFVWFVNAWNDPDAKGGEGFDVPFVINVIPEPASLALLAVGGLALLRRRK